MVLHRLDHLEGPVKWRSATLDALDVAIATARTGGPAILGIEGEAGFGKSTLLRDVETRLEDFRVLRGLGEESTRDEQFGLLQEWCGIPESRSPRHLVAAARLLAGVIDPLLTLGPVAIVLDDMQWMDPESICTVALLLRRTRGDRLLVLAAYRPLGRRHSSWRRLAAPTLRLDGLDLEGVAALVTDLAPDAPADLAALLREHTGGSPLYLRALLQEYSTRTLTALAARGELPAPADLAVSLQARLSGLPSDAARLLHTLAVLGDVWSDLPMAAAVGAVRNPDTAVEALCEEDLIRLDRVPTLPQVRIIHAVIRAAVYEAVPEPTRRELHRSAAARVGDPGARLRHRVAATSDADAGLAADLDRHADGLHERSLFREAGRFRRLAAGRSAGADDRERRMLDGDFEAILAHDLDEIDPRGTVRPHACLVEAMRLAAAKRWVRAAEVLDLLDDGDIEGLGALNAYRGRVLRGWTIVAAGRSAADALQPLRAAAASSVQDHALRGMFTIAYGHATQAVTERDQEVWGFHATMTLDRAALAATPEGLAQLSWRGGAYALTGSPDKAIGDLAVVTAHIDNGSVDLGDGAFHALLGFAYWMSGQWRRASISIDQARAAPRGAVHPVVVAAAPLVAVTTGEDLDAVLARSRETCLAGPLPAALHVADVAAVAALGFAGTPAQRREWRARRIEDFGDPGTRNSGIVPNLWMLAMGLAAAWAQDTDATSMWASRLSGRTSCAWRHGAVGWLRALARQACGEAGAGALENAVRAGLPGLPAFEALMTVDAADAAAHEASPEAGAAWARAEASLISLDAEQYAKALLPHRAIADDPLIVLSDREREVAALLLEGLSYAQIAQELFVTRSTVAHHLSKTYAKTNTSTRHEFTRLVRGVRR